MKSFIVLALFAAVALATPVVDPKTAVVVRYDNDNIGIDSYKFGYETSDGKNAQEEGVLTNVGTENEAIQVRGSYSYVDNDGRVFSVVYTAGPEGFQPVGDHIPKP